METVITYIGDVQVYIVSGFQSQTEKAVGVAGCSLMAFGIIDGGPIRDSEEDLSRMKPLITMFFCFFLRMMYLPDCIYSTGSF